jgi:hypothetical protein
MSYRILLAIIALLVLAGFLLIACGDKDEDNSDANDDDDDDDDSNVNVNNNYLSDGSDDDAGLQIPESSFAYMEEDFMALIDLNADDGPNCDDFRCDTPLGLWFCDFMDQVSWMWGGCFCGYECCYCNY